MRCLALRDVALEPEGSYLKPSSQRQGTHTGFSHAPKGQGLGPQAWTLVSSVEQGPVTVLPRADFGDYRTVNDMTSPAMAIAKAVMLTNLGEPTALPAFSGVNPAEVAMATAGIIAACVRSSNDAHAALWEARQMVDAPVAVAVVAAMLDGGSDVLEEASLMCSELANDRKLLMEMFALGRTVRLFADIDHMLRALHNLR